MQVRQHCRISSGLVQQCAVWTEGSLEVRGILVAIQDWGSEDPEETRDTVKTLDGSQDTWVLVLDLLWGLEPITSLLWVFS